MAPLSCSFRTIWRRWRRCVHGGSRLSNGVIQADGPIRTSLGAYRHAIEEYSESLTRPDGVVNLAKVQVGQGDEMARTDGPLDVTMVLEAADATPASLFLGVSEGPASPVFSLQRSTFLAAGETEVRCSIGSLPLPRGRFYLWVGVFGAKGHDLLQWHPAAAFDVAGPDLDPHPVPSSGSLRFTWQPSGRSRSGEGPVPGARAPFIPGDRRDEGGTTALWQYLRPHPQIYMPEAKEIDFFSSKFDDGLDWYARCFETDKPDVVAAGRHRRNYTRDPLFPGVPARIVRSFPRMRMIYLVRNPVG